MIKAFSAKNYLIENKLVNEKGEIVLSNIFPRSPAWAIGPYRGNIALIYLVTLIHFLNEKSLLDNIDFFTVNDGDDKYAYTIYMDERDRNIESNFDWSIIVETLDFLLLSMSTSNISRLSQNLFFKDE